MWKTDEKGNIVVVEGNPVWVGDDGSETPMDAKANIAAAASAKREAAESRTQLKAAKEALAAFDGIDDPTEAKKALIFASSLEGKKVMGDEDIKKAIESGRKPLLDELAVLGADHTKAVLALHNSLVGEKIVASEFLKKTTYTATDAKRIYAGNFKVEDEKVVPYDDNGSPIYSSTRAGEYATVDEALKVIIDSRPDKDSLYRGGDKFGAGSQSGGNPGGTTTASKLMQIKNPIERLTAAREAGLTT